MQTCLFTITLAAISLVGCSKTNDFKPSPEMSGADIFAKACVECHAPVGEFVMELSAEMNDADKIANKVLSGGFMMPSFPNIQGDSAKQLGEYVVENSTVK